MYSAIWSLKSKWEIWNLKYSSKNYPQQMTSTICSIKILNQLKTLSPLHVLGQCIAREASFFCPWASKVVDPLIVSPQRPAIRQRSCKYLISTPVNVNIYIIYKLLLNYFDLLGYVQYVCPGSSNTIWYILICKICLPHACEPDN